MDNTRKNTISQCDTCNKYSINGLFELTPGYGYSVCPHCRKGHLVYCTTTNCPNNVVWINQEELYPLNHDMHPRLITRMTKHFEQKHQQHEIRMNKLRNKLRKKQGTNAVLIQQESPCSNTDA